MGRLMTKESAKRVICEAIDECDTIAFQILVPAKQEDNYTRITVIPVY